MQVVLIVLGVSGRKPWGSRSSGKLCGSRACIESSPGSVRGVVGAVAWSSYLLSEASFGVVPLSLTREKRFQYVFLYNPGSGRAIFRESCGL